MTALRANLRFRVAVAFGAFALLIALAYTAAALGLFFFVEDATLSRQLYALAGQAAPTHDRLTVYDGRDALPPPLRAGFDPADPEPQELMLDGRETMVLESPPGRFLVLDIEGIEPSPRWVPPMAGGLALVGVLVVLLAGWLGFAATRRILAPLIDLARLVEQHGLDELPAALTDGDWSGEVGLLADRLDRAGRRVQVSLERERRFSRYASHELRTPVAIISSTLELLETRPIAAEPALAQPLDRIGRAVRDMQETIETFLWLARGGADTAREDVHLPTLLAELIERHDHLRAHRPVEVELRVEQETRLRAHPTALAVVLGNLLSNALRFTPSGIVEITVAADRVCIADSGVGIAAEQLRRVFEPGVHAAASTGYGLGLSIVRDLCAEFGWRVELSSAPARGTCVSLIFSAG